MVEQRTFSRTDVVTADAPSDSAAVVIVVDVANVMGARADGWWRDRAGAALRLCREVDTLAGWGMASDGDAAAAPVLPRYVLVLEGRARDAAGRIGSLNARTRIVRAPGSGDDTIVAESVAAVAGGASCLVVTADRELRERCREAGASVRGPGWLLDLL